MKTNIKKIASITAGFALVASILLGNSAKAAENQQNPKNANFKNTEAYRTETNRAEQSAITKPTVVGTVVSVNGNSITITSTNHQGKYKSKATSTPVSTPITYTVDATNSIVKKNNATSTVSSILVGDIIMVRGTINGTNIIATSIRDNYKNNNSGEMDGRKSTSTPPAFIGNGQPIVAGKILNVNGNSITVTTANNLTYTVDVTNAKILKGKDTATAGSLVVGDTVIVQGTINGSSVTASNVIDRGIVTYATSSVKYENKSQLGGFFGSIGRFFTKMFGF